MRKGRIARALTLALISPGESPKSAGPGAPRALALKFNHCADGFARMHQIKPLIDLIECQFMGDHRINFDLTIHIPIDKFWHIAAPFRAAKGRAFPDAPCHKLKGSRADLGPCGGNTDDDGNTPPAVAAF